MTISYALTSTQNGERVRLNVTGSEPIEAQVGDPSQTWSAGTYIEVVRVGPAPVSLVPFDGSVSVNYLSAGASSLNDGEYARVSLVSPGVWDMHVFSIVPKYVKPAPLITLNDAGTAIDFGSAGDHNVHRRMVSGSDVTITVQRDNFWTGPDEYFANGYQPTDPGPMPDGGSALFSKSGAGNLTFVGAFGVTLHYPDSRTVSKLNAKVTLIKVGPNEWDLEGHFDLAGSPSV